MPRIKPISAQNLEAYNTGRDRPETFRRRPQQAALPDRPSKWKMGARRVRRLLRPTIFAAMILVLMVLGAGLLRLASHGGTLSQRVAAVGAELGFRVGSILVQGREKTPDDSITQALGVRQGDPIFAVSLPEAKARLEKIAWVRSATVERVLPGTLRIVLDERRPFAVWQNHGNFTLIDQAGNVVSDSNIAAFVPVLPLVVGEGAPSDASRLIDLYNKYPPLAGRVLAAIRVGERRWDLCMTSGAIVQLPEGAEDPALARLADLQTGKQLLDRPLSDIDMRLPDRLRLTPLTGLPCGHTAPPSPASPPAADSDGGKSPQASTRRPA
jgi:cell division protein FtsQ